MKPILVPLHNVNYKNLNISSRFREKGTHGGVWFVKGRAIPCMSHICAVFKVGASPLSFSVRQGLGLNHAKCLFLPLNLEPSLC